MQVGDLSADRGGVEAVAVDDQFGVLGWCENVGVQQPLQGGLGLVVDPAVAPVTGGGVADGLAGGCQVVQPVVDQLP